MRGTASTGRAATQLHTITRVASRRLLPVYDEPMVYHPLSTLMLARRRHIFIIATPDDQPAALLLGDNASHGSDLSTPGLCLHGSEGFGASTIRPSANDEPEITAVKRQDGFIDRNQGADIADIYAGSSYFNSVTPRGGR